MKKYYNFLIILFLVAVPPSYAPIYKCMDNNQVVLQQMPCTATTSNDGVAELSCPESREFYSSMVSSDQATTIHRLCEKKLEEDAREKEIIEKKKKNEEESQEKRKSVSATHSSRIVNPTARIKPFDFILKGGNFDSVGSVDANCVISVEIQVDRCGPDQVHLSETRLVVSNPYRNEYSLVCNEQTKCATRRLCGTYNGRSGRTSAHDDILVGDITLGVDLKEIPENEQFLKMLRQVIEECRVVAQPK